jgi:hypothetical protein
MSATEDLTSSELREGYAEIGDQRLHWSRPGPLVVPLNGFPEYLWPGGGVQVIEQAAHATS